MRIALPFLLACTIYSTDTLSKEHAVQLGISANDFQWDEFQLNLQNRENAFVKEDGSLTAINAAYSFTDKGEKLKVEYEHTQGNVDYLGKRQGATISEPLRPSTADYSMNNLEAEYGAWFDMDYIKPYAAVIGGFHKRERDIAPLSTGTNALREDISYYYWGALLEAEIFNWNRFSFDIGTEFNRSVKTKTQATAYLPNEGGRTISITNIDLEPFITLKGYIRLNYEFLPSWKASLLFESGTSKKERSEGTTAGNVTRNQPRVTQRIDRINFSITKNLH